MVRQLPWFVNGRIVNSRGLASIDKTLKVVGPAAHVPKSMCCNKTDQDEEYPEIMAASGRSITEYLSTSIGTF